MSERMFKLGTIILPLIGFIGFSSFIYIGFAIDEHRQFYSVLILTVTIIALCLTIVALMQVIKPKRMLVITSCSMIIIGIVIGVYHLYATYYDNIATVSERGIDLHEYAPFREGTKAVLLGEPSDLVITENLPVLDGATALYPLYAAFAQAAYPAGDYPPFSGTVSSSSTPNAFNNLINEKADIIFTAEPSKDQRIQSERLGIDLRMTPIGKEAFVFFVHTDNPIEGVTIEQIKQIYSGQVSNWNEIGGESGKIRAFQRPEGSGSQTVLQKLMAGEALIIPPKENVSGGMGTMIEQTSDYRNFPNAIGYSFHFYTTSMVKNGDIRLLKIDGVAPNKQTIADGSYPLTANFYAVTAGSHNPNVASFIDWILSEQGQRLIELTGYTPISK
ncbi:PstS family phosphate ABC transporter substrate-binding protein [Paenibacillus sp. YIM B09110]|uniref:PstS family phosphate ABC transporter substrate-binding protein n=1 Tax=Paenibacillus sp. YIM B09110 TaxID=3126102 RepID=UPI00301E40D8